MDSGRNVYPGDMPVCVLGNHRKLPRGLALCQSMEQLGFDVCTVLERHVDSAGIDTDCFAVATPWRRSIGTNRAGLWRYDAVWLLLQSSQADRNAVEFVSPYDYPRAPWSIVLGWPAQTVEVGLQDCCRATFAGGVGVCC